MDRDVSRPEVPLEHLELLAVVKTHDVLRLDRLLNGNRRLRPGSGLARALYLDFTTPDGEAFNLDPPFNSNATYNVGC